MWRRPVWDSSGWWCLYVSAGNGQGISQHLAVSILRSLLYCRHWSYLSLWFYHRRTSQGIHGCRPACCVACGFLLGSIQVRTRDQRNPAGGFYGADEPAWCSGTQAQCCAVPHLASSAPAQLCFLLQHHLHRFCPFPLAQRGYTLCYDE